MAFVEPFDPTTPADDDLVSQGDDRIRELKRALSERLAQVIEGWPDTEPLKLKGASLDNPISPDTGTIKYGNIADRPNPPDTDFFWAVDENILYIAEPDLVTPANPDTWVAVNPDVTIPQVTFANMRTRTLQHASRIPIVNGLGQVQITMQLPGTPAPSIHDYIHLETRARCKLDSDAAFQEWWSVVGVKNPGALPLILGRAQTPGDAGTSIGVTGIIPYALDPTPAYLVFLSTEASAATDIDIEITMRLLAMSSSVPADA